MSFFAQVGADPYRNQAGQLGQALGQGLGVHFQQGQMQQQQGQLAKALFGDQAQLYAGLPVEQQLKAAKMFEQQKNQQELNQMLSSIYGGGGQGGMPQIDNQNNTGMQQPTVQNQTRKQPSDAEIAAIALKNPVIGKLLQYQKNAAQNEQIQLKKEQAKIDEVKVKRHTDISQDILKENEKDAQGLIASESALSLMEDAVANKDMSFFSPDNLAEITGIEALRSPEGAIFKTAGKEFFLGNLTRAGARPNQFIEKQIVEMLPKMGRSTAANLSVARAFRNEGDIKKEKVRLTRELSNELENKLGYIPRNLGELRDEKLKVYAENKQKELNNDLRALKSIEDKTLQPFMKVEPGTPISKVVAKAILNEFDPKDPKRKEKAEKKARELGYEF